MTLDCSRGAKASLWNLETASDHDVSGRTIMQAIQPSVDFKQLSICQEAELLPG